MRDHSRYWLSLVAEYTDLALVPEDVGMPVAAIPPVAVKGLGKMVKKCGDRVVITKLGRNFLKDKGKK